MTQIDIGNGQTIERGRVPANMLAALDQANTALASAQSTIRNWSKPLTVMQAPATFTGTIHCNGFNKHGVAQSGYVYNMGEVGGAMAVDPRDSEAFMQFGFTVVPSGPTSARPTTGLRTGLVFDDTTLGQTVRWDGAAWNPVTLT